MRNTLHILRIVFVLKQNRKSNSYYKRIHRKCNPYAMPVSLSVMCEIFINCPTGSKAPKTAPKPLVIIINNPCAEERILEFVDVSTNKEPEILKKSKAIPYTIQDKIIIHKPSVGFPKANNPKRNTQANIEINITCLIPKRFRKKGIAKMNKVFRNLRNRDQL